jgi:hypothetical protein
MQLREQLIWQDTTSQASGSWWARYGPMEGGERHMGSTLRPSSYFSTNPCYSLSAHLVKEIYPRANK